MLRSSVPFAWRAIITILARCFIILTHIPKFARDIEIGRGLSKVKGQKILASLLCSKSDWIKPHQTDYRQPTVFLPAAGLQRHGQVREGHFQTISFFPENQPKKCDHLYGDSI